MVSNDAGQDLSFAQSLPTSDADVGECRPVSTSRARPCWILSRSSPVCSVAEQLLLGGALVKIALNGDYPGYFKPAQQPWIIAGGAVMVLLGAVAIVRDILAARAKSGPSPEHGHAHSARPAWLL